MDDARLPGKSQIPRHPDQRFGFAMRCRGHIVENVGSSQSGAAAVDNRAGGAVVLLTRPSFFLLLIIEPKHPCARTKIRYRIYFRESMGNLKHMVVMVALKITSGMDDWSTGCWTCLGSGLAGVVCRWGQYNTKEEPVPHTASRHSVGTRTGRSHLII